MPGLAKIIQRLQSESSSCVASASGWSQVDGWVATINACIVTMATHRVNNRDVVVRWNVVLDTAHGWSVFDVGGGSAES